MDIKKLLKEKKIPYKSTKLNKKYRQKANTKESTILIANNSTFRSIAKEIAGRIVYNYLDNNTPKYKPVYLYKPIFTAYLNDNRTPKDIWKKTDALIFDGADEYNSKWDFQNIINLLTYRLYNDKLTIMIVTNKFKDRIREYNGNSFLSLLETANHIEIK